MGNLTISYPLGKQCINIDSSNDIVCFSKGGKDEIILGSNCSLYFLFNSSASHSYNQLFLYISGSTPTTKK